MWLQSLGLFVVMTPTFDSHVLLELYLGITFCEEIAPDFVLASLPDHSSPVSLGQYENLSLLL